MTFNHISNNFLIPSIQRYTERNACLSSTIEININKNIFSDISTLYVKTTL